MSFQKQASKLRSRAHLTGVKLPVLVGVSALVLCVILFSAFQLIRGLSNQSFTLRVQDEAALDASASVGEGKEGQEDAQDASESIFIHVSGAVAEPGVVELDEGLRVFDAVQAAGGFTELAAADSLNLARMLVDGEHIYVLTQEEYEQQVQASGLDVHASASSEGSAASEGSSASAGSSGLININTADASSLTALPGIGQKTAERIVADRQANGPFQTIEDLKRVSGIGDKKFQALRDAICV